MNGYKADEESKPNVQLLYLYLGGEGADKIPY